MVMFDFLSNYARFLLLKHPFIAHSVVAIFVKKIVRLHSYPHSTVSDKNKIFTSLFWEELFRVLGTQLQCIMTYHPQTDGQTKVVNWSIEAYLQCFTMGT